MIGAWDTHEINRPPINQKVVNKIVHNETGDYRVTMINRTTKINVNGILIEYEGEDSGIGLLFASKAAVQVSPEAGPGSGHGLPRIPWHSPQSYTDLGHGCTRPAHNHNE